MNATSIPVSANSEGTPEDGLQKDDDQSPALSSAGIFLMTNSFETGGSERQFVELARSLASTKHNVKLGCLQPKGPFRKEVGEVEHFTLGGSLYRFQSIRSRLQLARYLRRSAVAVAHAFDYYTNLTLIPAARLARTPVVIGSLRQLGDLLSSSQRRAQLAMFRWSDCVICNSRAAADTLARTGFREEKLAVIGNGLPPAAFAETAPILPRDTLNFRIGMIARMNALSKKHKTLLQVAAHLRTRLANFEIVLVGDGPLRSDLEQEAARLGVADVVKFLGNRRDVQAILASLDVTVMPSASESLSNAILESMAAGVPVIAHPVGGNAELIRQDTGILVPPDNIDALVAALQKLAVDTPQRESMGRNAKRFAKEYFTVEQMRKKHEELYAELLRRKGRRS